MNLFGKCAGKKLDGILQWLNEPPVWGFDGSGRLTIVPAGKTDFFRPSDHPGSDNAGLLYAFVAGDFTARAHVTATLASFGDAGALTVRTATEQWAKICVERSPAGEASIVSVVTNTWSDDANSELLGTPEAFLRITRKGDIFGMHYSLDGKRWRFVRAFTLKMPAQVLVGVHAQAPFGTGCRVEFGFLELDLQSVVDFRSGE